MENGLISGGGGGGGGVGGIGGGPAGHGVPRGDRRGNHSPYRGGGGSGAMLSGGGHGTRSSASPGRGGGGGGGGGSVTESLGGKGGPGSGGGSGFGGGKSSRGGGGSAEGGGGANAAQHAFSGTTSTTSAGLRSSSTPPSSSSSAPRSSSTAAAGRMESVGHAPTDKELRARKRIESNKYDLEAWGWLTTEAQARPAESAALYEFILSCFPSSARHWKMYAETQISAGNDDAVKSIFSRSLLNCLHIDLWRCYLRYIRKVNDGRGVEGREETKRAFEFMLEHVGYDISACQIWMEYISFLKSIPGGTAQEESQRMTAIRKVYQRVILIPMHGIDGLWKDYESFENSVSRALAKGLLAEYQPKHFSARAVYRERKKYFEHLDLGMLAVPPSGSLKDEQQCVNWKKLIAFEKSNPQRLDAAMCAKRVAFTYEQCLMYLYHYPDMWYNYATWQAEQGQHDPAVRVFQRALMALPDSAVLHYAFAEYQESNGNVRDARSVYDALIRNDAAANALAYIQFMRFIRRTEGVDAARKVFMAARKSPMCTYHVYVASAKMELCIDKDPKVARNIFELGLKKYIHEPAYILEYLDFLMQLNDDRNIRALLERALSVLPPEESAEVWDKFLEFELLYGDLQSVLKVEKRRREVLQDGGEGTNTLLLDDRLEQLVSRYRYLELWPCSPGELEHVARQQLLLQKAAAAKSADRTQQGAAFRGHASSSNMVHPIDQGGPPPNPPTVVTAPTNIVRPDVGVMAVYDPRQGLSGPIPGGPSGLHPTLAGSMLGPAPLAFGGALLPMPPPHLLPPNPMIQTPLPPGMMPLPPPAAALISGGGRSGSSISSGRPPVPPLPPGPPPGTIVRPIVDANTVGPTAAATVTTTPGPGMKSAVGVDDAVLKQLPPAVALFFSMLPPIPGPYPDPDLVISILMQSDLAKIPGSEVSFAESASAPTPAALVLSHSPIHASMGPQRIDGGAGQLIQPTPHPMAYHHSHHQQQQQQHEQYKAAVQQQQKEHEKHHKAGGSGGGGVAGSGTSGQQQRQQGAFGKRKEPERMQDDDEDDVPAAHNQPPPRDIFRMRQMQRARGSSSGASSTPTSGSGDG
ncbi:hypothetical protein CBR_g19801 [Chara braunii]|uniref:Suppressor of forked domain-containing protein n=1 Tax=Chara braunii TaxID=69332 RepID=A0A388JTY0_CHABU|nr:hypothetical protein CBR_g19801 [Chara braunii]|eukprot:GBG61269.1 hypothetical protein CBR_g19801 [Chara braunii]